jgi:hypothetical protein
MSPPAVISSAPFIGKVVEEAGLIVTEHIVVGGEDGRRCFVAERLLLIK